MIRIILIDDHTLVRHGIRQLLQTRQKIQIVGEAGTGIEAIQLARDLTPDVVLLDLKLPDITGLEVTIRLQRLKHSPRVLIFSGATAHLEFLRRTLAAGASGYLVKEASREELIQAIETVHKGQFFLSSDIANRLALAKIDPSTDSIFKVLSNREIEILVAWLKGISIAGIAKQLHTSLATTHGYRSHIFKKLNVENDVQLLLLAIREGLITVDQAGQDNI